MEFIQFWFIIETIFFIIGFIRCHLVLYPICELMNIVMIYGLTFAILSAFAITNGLFAVNFLLVLIVFRSVILMYDIRNLIIYKRKKMRFIFTFVNLIFWIICIYFYSTTSSIKINNSQ
jgi:hypothetical protein